MQMLVLEHTLPISSRERLVRNDKRTELECVKLVRDQRLVEEEDCPFCHVAFPHGIWAGSGKAEGGCWHHKLDSRASVPFIQREADQDDREKEVH